MRWWRRKGRESRGERRSTPAPPVLEARRYDADDPAIDARLEEILAVVDREAFTELRERHAALVGRPGPGKYLDLRTWLRRHLVHARALGLFECAPRRMLDLGTGNGYFPFVAGRLGHDVVALDLDDNPLFNDLVALLGVDRRVHRIRCYEALPELGGPFDLVTAFNVGFNDQNRETMWEAAEWEYFLRDVATHQLRPGGQIFLKLNPFQKPGGYDEAPLLALFERLGADMSPPFFHFRPGDGLIPPG